MSAEYPDLGRLPHCEFLRAWDKNELNPDIIVWDSFCGLTPEEHMQFGPDPCEFPCGLPGYTSCEGRAKKLEEIK